MRKQNEAALLDQLARLNDAEAARVVRAMDSHVVLGANEYFPHWAHGGQLPPHDDWQTWVVMAGRGFGKTRAGAEWIAAMVRKERGLRIALVAATAEEARRIMVEGTSGLLDVAGSLVVEWSPYLKLVRFANDNEVRLFSGASPEQLRGPEHHIAWCDELAKWEKPGDTWDMLQLGLRLGDHPRVLVTTTPQPGPVLARIMAQNRCITTHGRTYANPHVSVAYQDTIRDLYEGTRLGRQEIDGELLGAAGALWTVELIERCRILPGDTLLDTAGDTLLGVPCDAPVSEKGTPNRVSRAAPPFTRTLIAVDPPTGEGTCGIIACARDAQAHVHVLADHSVTGRSPEGWARAVGAAAAAHDTREVIAEANQGGQMVKSVLLAADPDLHVRLVNAAQGKAERAEPVAHRFEAGKAWFAGRFPELEAQLLGLIAGGGYDGPGRSPDRADAMVWGLSMLMKPERVVQLRVV